MSIAKTAPGGILVPLDGSALAEQAIPYATLLCSPGAALTLLRVVNEPESTHALARRDLARGEGLLTLAERQAHSDLATVAGTLQSERSNSTPAHALVVSGEPAEQIRRVAAEREVELIVMTTHARGAIGRWAFGSVADRVARTSTVPVMLVRPVMPRPVQVSIRRLIVPLDGSALAEEALPIAARLAARLDIPVLLVQAIDPALVVPSAPSPGVPVIAGELTIRIGQELRDQATATLDAAAKQLATGGVRAETEILTGAAANAIVRLATPGDVIILTSHGRSGLQRWLMGSVAERLVREAPVPVLLAPVAGRRTSTMSQTGQPT